MTPYQVGAVLCVLAIIFAFIGMTTQKIEVAYTSLVLALCGAFITFVVPLYMS